MGENVVVFGEDLPEPGGSTEENPVFVLAEDLLTAIHMTKTDRIITRTVTKKYTGELYGAGGIVLSLVSIVGMPVGMEAGRSRHVSSSSSSMNETEMRSSCWAKGEETIMLMLIKDSCGESGRKVIR